MYFKKEKALILYKGGLDSTVLLLWAKELFKEVYALTFYYDFNEEDKIRIEKVKNICNELNIPLKILDISFLKKLEMKGIFNKSDSGDLSNEKLFFVDNFTFKDMLLIENELPKKISESSIENFIDTQKSSYIPLKNTLFFTIAASYLQTLNDLEVKHIISGLCSIDFYIPTIFNPDNTIMRRDSRDFYIKALQTALNIAMFDQKRNITIQTPFLYKEKKEIFKIAHELNSLDFVIKNTISCYGPQLNYKQFDWGIGCGECIACEYRKKGYEDYTKSLT